MSCRAVSSWVVLVLFSFVLAGAQRPPLRPRPPLRQPPATPVVPLVTVFKTDATSVRGEIAASDPDAVTITVPARRGSTEPPVPLVVPWTEIRSMSNGLTRDKAIVQWKQVNREKLCDTCRGDRVVRCDTCKGTAHDPAAAKDCPSCHGELLLDCKAARCDAGQAPCTNKCLKLTEGRWVLKEDGKRWRAFPTRRGVHTFSESHVGNLLQTDREGTITDVGRCPTCGGTTRIDCRTCRGHGNTPCALCTARKDAAPCPSACDSGRVPCKPCNASGLKGDGRSAEEPA